MLLDFRVPWVHEIETLLQVAGQQIPRHDATDRTRPGAGSDQCDRAGLEERIKIADCQGTPPGELPYGSNWKAEFALQFSD